MKKIFNLSVILAVLMAAFSFTSCGDDDEDAASVSINVETTATSAIVSVVCDEDLKSVELWQNGEKIKNIEVKTGTKTGNATVFTLIGLTTGAKYTIKVTSDTGAADKEFTVGSTDSFSLMIGGASSSEGSYISISNKAVYTVANANANVGNIEIIFKDGKFMSAKESTNTSFKKENAGSASITMDGDNKGCTFVSTTASGVSYKGTIKSNEVLGDATYTVTVVRSAK